MKTAFLSVLMLLSLLALLLPVANFPHYAAPATCATYALLLQSMRRVKIWDRNGRKKGRFVVRSVVTTCFIIFFATASALLYGIPHQRLLPFDMVRTNLARAQIERSLRQQGGKYLIVVHYAPDHLVHNEWVYNHADIDGSCVVWAREMTPAQDKQLLDYFKDRHVFLLQADANPPMLEPYPQEQLQPAADH